MTITEALAAERHQLGESYIYTTKRAARIVEDYATKQPSDHFGHNLGAVAAELSVLAGKIEAIDRVMRFQA